MISLEILLSFVIVVVSLVFIFFKIRFNYWKKKNVYSVKPTIPFGNFKDTILRRISLGKQLNLIYNDLRKENLKFGGVYLFSQPFLVVADLDLIRNIFVKDFQHFSDHMGYVNEKIDPLSGNLFGLKGAKWKAMRSKLTPTFTSGKLKMMFETLLGCTEHLDVILDECVANSEPFEVKETLARFTTDVIGSTAFGIDCNCLKNPDTEFRKYGRKVFEVNFVQSVKTLISLAIPKFLEYFDVSITNKEVERFFSRIVKETVEYREKNNIDRKDFMKLLLQLKNEVISVEGKGDNHVVFSQNGLTLNEITAQAFVFFVAGFETSSTALTFLMYELCLNPDIQAKLRAEINEILKKYDGKITYEAITEMKYLDKCFKETLRKHPPGTALSRECTKSYQFPDSNLTLDKGDAVFIPVFGIHHDPKYYPDPEKFDPERFSEENEVKRHPMAFLPFGEGPRICIGLRFAAMQVKVGVVKLLKDYKFSFSSKTKIPMEYNPRGLVLSLNGKLWLNVEKN